MTPDDERMAAIERTLSEHGEKLDRILNICMALADDQLGTRRRVELLESEHTSNGGE